MMVGGQFLAARIVNTLSVAVMSASIVQKSSTERSDRASTMCGMVIVEEWKCIGHRTIVPRRMLGVQPVSANRNDGSHSTSKTLTSIRVPWSVRKEETFDGLSNTASGNSLMFSAVIVSARISRSPA